MYENLLNKDYQELIQFFKKWHKPNSSGHGDLFSRIIVKIQYVTKLSNRKLAKELGTSKSLITQAKTYLRLASPRLIDFVRKNYCGINTAYFYARIENYEKYHGIIPESALEHVNKNAPHWIINICSNLEPLYHEIKEGEYAGFVYRRGYKVK